MTHKRVIWTEGASACLTRRSSNCEPLLPSYRKGLTGAVDEVAALIELHRGGRPMWKWWRVLGFLQDPWGARECNCDRETTGHDALALRPLKASAPLGVGSSHCKSNRKPIPEHAPSSARA